MATKAFSSGRQINAPHRPVDGSTSTRVGRRAEIAAAGIDAPLYLCRYDGTLVGEEYARAHPIVTRGGRRAALARGAAIHGEILGYGASNDAYHRIAPDPTAAGAVRAIRSALRSARIAPEQVDYINAHATSTPQGDIAETKAIKTVLGDRAYQVPVSATKSMIGHLFGAAGAVEGLATLLALRDGVLPPTINLDHPDPECDLDYVPHHARRAPIHIALSNSFGLGGQNAVIAMARYEGCLLYTSPSPRDGLLSRMPSSA